MQIKREKSPRRTIFSCLVRPLVAVECGFAAVECYAVKQRSATPRPWRAQQRSAKQSGARSTASPAPIYPSMSAYLY